MKGMISMEYTSENLESISIEITKLCNLNCKFCYASSNQVNKEEQYITDDQLQRVVEQIKKNKIKKVRLTGGEPLLKHELFYRIIKILNENNITINLNTNLSLIDDEIAKEIKDYIGSEFYVFTSLLSPVEKTCDSITGVKGSYKKIIEGMNCCKRNGLKLSVNFTISKDNISDLDLIYDFVKKYKIDRTSISAVIPPVYDRYSDINKLSDQDITNIANMLVKINRELHIPVTSSHTLPLCIIGNRPEYKLIESQRCRAGYNYCCINLHSGNVFACSQENRDYGNIYQKDLYDIWLEMKKEHSDTNLKLMCQNCELLDECGGMCKWSSCSSC